jgi:hypothetical protein
MIRTLILAAALPQFFGACGHAYLGERDIFPKLAVASTGLAPASLRILRLTWHLASLSFVLMGSTLTLLAFKAGPLSKNERRIAIAVSLWYAITGIACVGYWDYTKPQSWVFLLTAVFIQLGLHWTP